MNEYLQLKKANCKNCYKCIRSCPVKSIRFSDNQAIIINDECILCGMCFVACPQNAKQIRNDIDVVKKAIRAGKKVYASIAPSFIADFDVAGICDMEKILQSLGFAQVQETAIGAEMVKKRYEQIIASRKQSIIISSCCHSINSLIQKYYPAMLAYLAKVLSPMQAHCKLIKEQDPEAFTVFIGPCISKKQEADLCDYTDVVLTFDDLRQWLDEEGIRIDENQSDSYQGNKARYFPTTGGIIKSMNKDEDFKYIAIDGVENCIATFKELEEVNLKNVFIEMSACVGSCINGPCIREHRSNRALGAIKISDYAGENDYETYHLNDIDKQFGYVGLHNIMPGEQAIREVLIKMGKTDPSLELNCGSCGYNTCREKAIAVCQGKADLTMCLPFLKEKAESFSDNIISNTPNAIFVLDEDLIVQQINNSACKLFNLKNPCDILHQPIANLLDPIEYINVVRNDNNIYNKSHYIAEYNKFVDETIIYDRQYHIIVSIMRDITETEKVQQENREIRQRTIETMDKVIEKQMRVVQDIASLLGETTAETKIALTKLKETLQK